MEGEESYEGSWLRLNEGLIGGIHHALNNRTGALGGALQVLEGDLPAGHPLMGALLGEVRRLEATTGLLGLLAADSRDPQAVALDDVLDQATRLFEMHHALRDLRLAVEREGEILPLRTSPAELLRALLLMMVAGAGAGDGVKLLVAGDESFVRISADVGPGEADGGIPRVSPGDLEDLAGRLGGGFEASGEAPARWTLVLPTLLEVRRREQR